MSLYNFFTKNNIIKKYIGCKINGPFVDYGGSIGSKSSWTILDDPSNGGTIFILKNSF